MVSRPLLVVDGDSFAHRAYHALPKSILRRGGNAIDAAVATGAVLDVTSQNDTGIGQRIEDLATAVDIVSPMLYPSGFQFGIPGYRNPVDHPYEIVHLTLEECKRRTAGTALRYRPWLQAFTDYAFSRKAFGADEIAKQTKASRDSGTDGWMLWNPRNVYTTNDIKPE